MTEYLYTESKKNKPNQWLKMCGKYYALVKTHAGILNASIKPENDYNLDYFALKILQRYYLWRVGDEVVESPQYLFMRVAIQAHRNSVDEIIETYNLLSEKYFILDGPVLQSSGSQKFQFSSSFTLSMAGSIEGVFKCLNQSSCISKLEADTAVNLRLSKFSFSESPSLQLQV